MKKFPKFFYFIPRTSIAMKFLAFVSFSIIAGFYSVETGKDIKSLNVLKVFVFENYLYN